MPNFGGCQHPDARCQFFLGEKFGMPKNLASGALTGCQMPTFWHPPERRMPDAKNFSACGELCTPLTSVSRKNLVEKSAVFAENGNRAMQVFVHFTFGEPSRARCKLHLQLQYGQYYLQWPSRSSTSPPPAPAGPIASWSR